MCDITVKLFFDCKLL